MDFDNRDDASAKLKKERILPAKNKRQTSLLHNNTNHPNIAAGGGGDAAAMKQSENQTN